MKLFVLNWIEASVLLKPCLIHLYKPRVICVLITGKMEEKKKG